MLFKKKKTAATLEPAAPAAPAPAVGAEWEQTLVATEAPPEPAPPAPDFLPVHDAQQESVATDDPIELIEPAPEPAPQVEAVPDTSPLQEPTSPDPIVETVPPPPPPATVPVGTGDEPASTTRVPVDLEPYVRIEGNRIILRESHLTPEQKYVLERHFSPDKNTTLQERRWYPHRREALHQIEKAVDEMRWTPRFDAKATLALRDRAAARWKALQSLERIPANILAKRIVYETEGGYVVEVTYRELGQSLRKYFTVPARGTATASLQAVKSGELASVAVVSPQLLDILTRRPGKPRKHVRPGKIRTWPIRHKFAVSILPQLTKKHLKELQKLGIHTTDQLRVRSPVVIARHLRFSPQRSRAWLHESELLLVNGVGTKYAHALTKAGVKGIDGLRRMRPTALAEGVNAVLDADRSRTKPPRVTRNRAITWIRNAKKTRKTLQSFPT